MFLEFNKFLAAGSRGGKEMLAVSSRGSCSHNFVIVHLLVNASRNKKKVHLICSGESRHFYSLVCQRAGVSVQQMESAGQLRTTCLVSAWKQQISSGSLPIVPDLTKDVVGDEDLIVIDDLLPMLDFASSPNDVVRCVHALKSRAGPACTLVLGLRVDDAESQRLSRFIRTMSSLWVDVHPLSTGYSKDIHGVMEMWSLQPDRGGGSHSKMHYKVTERGAKLWVVGAHTAIT